MGYAYWVIDSVDGDGARRFRVWRREGADAELAGEYPSLAAAKASVPVTWRDAGSEGLSAWAMGTVETPLQQATLTATQEPQGLIA